MPVRDTGRMLWLPCTSLVRSLTIRTLWELFTGWLAGIVRGVVDRVIRLMAWLAYWVSKIRKMIIFEVCRYTLQSSADTHSVVHCLNFLWYQVQNLNSIFTLPLLGAIHESLASLSSLSRSTLQSGGQFHNWLFTDCRSPFTTIYYMAERPNCHDNLLRWLAAGR